MENRPPPEFGPNGAVMNNPAMGERLRAEYRGEEVPLSERQPETLRGRLIASGGRLLLASFWLFIAWRNGWVEFLPLAGFCMLMSAGVVVRSFWPMGPREKSIWERVFQIGALAALLIAIWWLAPLDPFWMRMTASGLFTAYVLRSFWRFGRIEVWVWAAVQLVGAGFIVWASA